MAVVIIDGKELQLDEAEQLNIIEAAERLGIRIPYYCWHPGLSVVASCRMCLVEIGHRGPDGVVRMQDRLVPACQTPATDGTVVVTNSEKVKANRRHVQELLLLDHPVDCPICDRAGECMLQDYYFEHGHAQRREEPVSYHSRRRHVGANVTLFVDRCISCSRCVRFTREISGGAELHFVERGERAEIDIWPSRPLDNPLSTNVVDLCPVGALCSRDFLYKQRVWFLHSHQAVCVECSAGCSSVIDENRGRIYRIRPRYNPHSNTWWMCDFGRFSYKQLESAERLTEPQVRDGSQLKPCDWPTAYSQVHERLRQFVDQHGGSALALAISPAVPCEAGFMAAEYIKSVSARVRLALGPVPVEGDDQLFPQLPGGRKPEQPKFVVRAEKVPNRLGIETLLRHYEGQVLEFERLAELIRSNHVRGLVLVAGYLKDAFDAEWLELVEGLELFVLVDNVASKLLGQACCVLPCRSWAEQGGSYVNCTGLMQTMDAILAAPGQTRSVGRIFWELAGREGPYRAGTVRLELASKIPAFAPANVQTMPEHGVQLDVTS